MQPTQSLPKPSDRWIPWYIFGFFGLLIIILVPMAIIAVRTNTGIVTDNPYEKGLAYNNSIQAEQRQEALKWQGHLTVETLASSNVKATFSLADASGAPLDKADVKLWFVRPTQDGIDRNMALHERSGGQYSAEFSLPVRGLWEARVSVMKDGKNYQLINRIVLP
ncbi:MAG: FixH family protein [Alphaproteobacteria bacterium]